MDFKNTYKEIGSKIISAISLLYKIVKYSLLSLIEHVEDVQHKIPHWQTREKAHPAIIRYGVAIVLCLIVIILKNAINPLFLNEPPFLFFYAAIVITAWYGGTRPGVLATIISTVLSYIYYLPYTNPTHTFSNVLAAGLFMFEGLLVVGISRSMHHAMQSYEERKRHTQYYASIAQHIYDAVISTDMNLVIQSWNEGAEMLYGWKASEVIGESLNSIVPSIYPASVRKSVQDVIAQEGHWRGEAIHQKKNGSRIHILTSLSQINDNDGSALGIVFVNRDITDRKKLEQGKDDFIALASHELKTPLTSVKLYTSVLKQKFTKSKDTNSLEYLSKIDVQMSKLLELVNHLLDVSKAQAGKIRFQLEEASIDDFVHEVVHDIQQITSSHTFILKGKTDKYVMIDKDRLRQALVNILNNAVKYSAQAKEVVVTLTKDPAGVKISIRDFGMGIPREKQDKIFERFYQVSDDKGYTYAGLGLGLYITREIIEKHSGKLVLESEEGKGSTFSFILPTVKKSSHEHK